MTASGAPVTRRGQHIFDWDARKRDEAQERLRAARSAVPETAITLAMRAYENAPPGTGLEGRMALAIHAVTRRRPAVPLNRIQVPGDLL